MIQIFLKLFRVGLALYFLLAVLCVVGTLIAFFGQYNWLVDLCSHFRLLYLIALIPAVLIAFFEKPQRWAFYVFIGALLLNLTQIVPMFFSNAITETTGSKSGKPVVTVLQMNIYAGNDDYMPVINTIKRHKPDIVVLEEFMIHQANALQKGGIFKLYPYSLRDLNTVNAVLSRYPLKGHMEFAGEGDENPLIVSEITVAKNKKEYPFTLITIHPERANKGKVRAERQIVYFKRVLATAAKYPADHPLLVAGDYNATPWSYPFRVLTENTGLYSASQGFGPIPTFPRYLARGKLSWPLPLLPIDHLVANKAVQILERKTLEDTHSDHLPTWTAFTFR